MSLSINIYTEVLLVLCFIFNNHFVDHKNFFLAAESTLEDGVLCFKYCNKNM